MNIPTPQSGEGNIMKLLLCVLALFILLFSFGQTIYTGYAVVTHTSRTGGGLSVSETLGELTSRLQ
jgi:hypothetical protein